MILPDCKIISRQNERDDYSGIDSEDRCHDLKHFLNYPYHVKYAYNSRGFRGPEWPNDLNNVIWCLGDSFTAGLGAPESHTWWHLLSEIVGRQCINISLDGASNQWISRWAQEIIKQVRPSTMIVHWSFTHRRELPAQVIRDQVWQEYYNKVKDQSWPECASYDLVNQLPKDVVQNLQADPMYSRYCEDIDFESQARIFYSGTSDLDDAKDTETAILQLENCKQNCEVIHSHIPNWHATQLKFDIGYWVREFPQIDKTRDGIHYDIETAKLFVSRILEVLEI